MKLLGIVVSSAILVCGCDTGRRFSSPTAPRVPAELLVPTPTSEPQQRVTHPVYGVVYEVTAAGRERIEGAWVAESSEFHAGAYSAADGSYRFTGLPEGANVMVVSKGGYHTAMRDFTVSAELRLDVELVRR